MAIRVHFESGESIELDGDATTFTGLHDNDPDNPGWRPGDHTRFVTNGYTVFHDKITFIEDLD